MDAETIKLCKELGLKGREISEFFKEREAAKKESEERAAAEAEKARAETEKVRAHEIKMLELQNNRNNRRIENFELAPFIDGEDDIYRYVEDFEYYAQINKWNPNNWGIYLATFLTGNALGIYARMPSNEANDYYKLKCALLPKFYNTEVKCRLMKEERNIIDKDNLEIEFVTSKHEIVVSHPVSLNESFQQMISSQESPIKREDSFPQPETFAEKELPSSQDMIFLPTSSKWENNDDEISSLYKTSAEQDEEEENLVTSDVIKRTENVLFSKELSNRSSISHKVYIEKNKEKKIERSRTPTPEWGKVDIREDKKKDAYKSRKRKRSKSWSAERDKRSHRDKKQERDKSSSSSSRHKKDREKDKENRALQEKRKEDERRRSRERRERDKREERERRERYERDERRRKEWARRMEERKEREKLREDRIRDRRRDDRSPKARDRDASRNHDLEKKEEDSLEDPNIVVVSESVYENEDTKIETSSYSSPCSSSSSSSSFSSSFSNSVDENRTKRKKKMKMNDLAKGTEVEKVYESHPLGMEIEGIKPKRERGRPRKDSNEKRKKTCNFTVSDLTETQVRPKRNRYLPSRFRDSLAGKEFDKLLSTDGTINRVNACDIQTENDLKEFLEENSNLSESATTHTLEGNTVVVTSNHRDELYDKLPEAVNIEFDFSNGKDSNYKYRRKGKIIIK
ncbi:UNVERIFIED_CONTAM: hypothetical protein RMT77_011686 [Armadillidium vulgare]